MRTVHLIRLSADDHHSAYGPTWRPGAPLVVEFVPDAVSDYEVARLATVRAVVVAFGERRMVSFGSLDRRRAGRSPGRR